MAIGFPHLHPCLEDVFLDKDFGFSMATLVFCLRRCPEMGYLDKAGWFLMESHGKSY